MALIERVAFFALPILIGCSSAPKAPSPQQLISDDYSRVRAYLKEYLPYEMAKHNIVGLSAALVDDQRIVWSAGFGYADKSNKISAKNDTLYRAASVSKILTAIAVMQLNEIGKVDIDAPLGHYLKEFKLKSRFGSIDQITLRNTLSHHAGIPANIAGMWTTEPESFKTVVSRLNDYYTAYPPNTLFAYSNAGYSLVGHTIENASGVAFRDYMFESVFRPMGMQSSTYIYNPKDEKMSKSYWRGNEVEELPIRDLPAGGLVTNVIDLAQIIKMVNADGASDGHVLEVESLKEMLSVQRYDTPYEPDSLNTVGWFRQPGVLDDKYFAVGHNGQAMAHSALLVVVPELDLGVVLLANTPSLEGQLDHIANSILKVAYPVKTQLDLEKQQGLLRSPIIGAVTTFDGVFSSEAGLADVEKAKVGYDIRVAGENFELKPGGSGQYKVKYKLLGFIPVAPESLKELTFHARDENGKKLVFVETPSVRRIIASEVSADDRRSSWDARIGAYEVLNSTDTDISFMKLNSAELGYANNVYYLEFQTPIAKMRIPLKIVDDSEATLQGYTSGLGETILAKDDDMLIHAGLILKRKQ